ncbi:fimbriae protein TadE/F [Pontimonas salivibrio]|uniref:Fimbriae protein TadE/F n=1 Tax=Pontimonas salivibrio TaxID=1159327 RepID=A0A2L2BNZ3_9MICO|nr:fimbriae protein TadE/F [Pontimonas salivibrio]
MRVLPEAPSVDSYTRGSGVVVALGVIAALVIAGSAALMVVDLLRFGEKVQHAANLSALAASDVAMGVIPGRPCVVAREIGRSQGIRVSSCEVTGSLVRVYATTTRHGLSITKRAAAGPISGGVWPDGDVR